MTAPLKFAAEPRGACYYGIDIAEDGALVVAQRVNGRPATAMRYPAGAAGVSALRDRIASNPARPRVCIRSSSAAALALAMGLAPLSCVEVTLVAPRTIDASARAGRGSAPMNPDERAQRLADLAARLV